MRIGIPEGKALLPAKSALLTNLMLLLLAVIGIMFVAWFLGNATIVKRLSVLVDASRKLGHGDLKIRTGLVDYKNDELGGLAKTFDEMAESLERKHIEREEAEGHIKKAVGEWRTTFDSITDAAMILNNEFKIMGVNSAMTRFFDMPIDKIIGNFCFSLMHGTDRPLDICTFREMITTKKHAGAEVYDEKRGIWVAVSVDPVFNGDGNLESVVHIMKDITDRKQGEERLRQSEERFRALVEKSSEVIVLYDKDRQRTYVSPTVTRIFGYSVEEYYALDRFELVHPDDIAQTETTWSEIRPGETVTTTNRLRHKDGSWRWVERTIRNLLDEPSVHSLVANFHDITDRKQGEEVLYNERQRFQTLADNATFGMILEGEDETITYINPMFKTQFGYDLSDIPNGRNMVQEGFPE